MFSDTNYSYKHYQIAYKFGPMEYEWFLHIHDIQDKKRVNMIVWASQKMIGIVMC